MKRFLVCFLLIYGFLCATLLTGEKGIGFDDDDGQKFIFKSPQTHNKEKQRIEAFKENLNLYKSLKKTLEDLENKLGKEKAFENPEYIFYSNKIKKIEQDLNDNLQTKLGRAVMKGFNKNLDENINSVWEGIGLGVAATAAKGFGGVLEQKIKDATENTGGRAWDNAWESISDFCGNIKNNLFYDGHKPFFLPELGRWKKFIMISIGNVLDAAKEGGSSHSRNRDMTYRESENGDPIETEEIQKDSEKSSWTLLATGYANQLDYIIKLVEDRRAHYDAESEESFYAGQIKQRLIEFRDALLRSDSITAFYTFYQSNPALLKAQGANIENLFTQLMIKVGGSTNDSRGGRSEKSSSMFGDDDDLVFGHASQY